MAEPGQSSRAAATMALVPDTFPFSVPVAAVHLVTLPGTIMTDEVGTPLPPGLSLPLPEGASFTWSLPRWDCASSPTECASQSVAFQSGPTTGVLNSTWSDEPEVVELWGYRALVRALLTAGLFVGFGLTIWRRGMAWMAEGSE